MRHKSFFVELTLGAVLLADKRYANWSLARETNGSISRVGLVIPHSADKLLMNLINKLV